MSRLYRIYPFLLIISAFCPYVNKSLGIKVEHLILFPVLLICVLLAFAKGVRRELITMVYLWSGLVAFVSVRSFLSDDSAGLMAFADLGNLMLPLCLMFFYLIKVENDEKNDQELVIKAIRWFNFLLILNSVLICISFIGYDISSIQQVYWKGFVAENSLSNGRYTGIFNQPMESGLAYSVGVLGWLYVVEKQKKVSFFNVVSMALLFVGGATSVSKVFLVGGLSLFLLGAARNKAVRKNLLKLFIFATPLIYAAYCLLNENWSGTQYLIKFLTNDNSGNLLDNLTSGRFGGQSSMHSMFGEVWGQHPMIGLGLGNNSVFDSLWFQAFGLGGTIGLTIMLAFVLVLLWKAFEYRFVKGAISESRFFGSLVILCVLSSVGSPVFSLNRSSIVMWVLLSLLLVHKSKHQPIVSAQKS